MELVKIFRDSNSLVLGMTQHKITHKDKEICYKYIEGSSLITQSARGNDQNAACGGVEILLEKRDENALAEVKSYKEWIFIAKFSANLTTVVIVNYSLPRRHRRGRRTLHKTDRCNKRNA